MPTIIMIFFQSTFVLVTSLHIWNISAVTGANFNRCQPLWWYLSSKHLSWRHLSIPGIYQLLLSQFWPNFKGRLQKNKLTSIFFVNIILPKFLYPNVFLCPMFFWTPIFFGPNFFLNLKFFNLNVLDKLFIYQNLFGSNTFWP